MVRVWRQQQTTSDPLFDEYQDGVKISVHEGHLSVGNGGKTIAIYAPGIWLRTSVESD